MDGVHVAPGSEEFEAVELGYLALPCDDRPRSAVGRTEIRVPGGDDATDPLPVGRVVEEVDHLARDGSSGGTATVGRGHQHEWLTDREWGVATSQGDPGGREADFADEPARVF